MNLPNLIIQDYVNGLMCVRDVDGDSKSFAAMDMLPFSTTSAAGHDVQVGVFVSYS